MTQREPRRRTGLNLWLVLALLPIFSFTCWFCLQDDDSVAPSSSPPSIPAPQLAAAQPFPAFFDEPDASVDGEHEDAGVDGGLDGGLDAGRPRAPEPSAAEVAAYVEKWRAALAPILRNARPIDPKAITSESDAGVALKSKCTEGEHTLPLGARPTVDIVIAVDSSGSMFSAGLDIAADFIGRLEYRLVSDEIDYRLIVLAEPRVLRLTTDAGISSAPIESHDGLDVLISTARDMRPGWLQFTRDGAELRLLLITDDGPDLNATEADFTTRLSQLLGRSPTGRGATFSVLGGFKSDVVLTSNEPLAPQLCRGTFRNKFMHGLDPGRVYQQVAGVSGGVRASICSDAARAGLLEVLASKPESLVRCEWSLHPDVRLLDVRGRSARGTELFLLREPTPAGCPGLKQSYLYDPPVLAMCPETCAELKLRNINEVSVRVECGK